MNHCPTCKCSPTQELRNLAEDMKWGFAGSKEINDAITRLERKLNLPATEYVFSGERP